MSKSKKIRKLNLFKKLFKAQDGKCIICGRFMSPLRSNFPSNNDATREHLLPKSKGGTNRNNILLSCYGCNTSRGSKPLKNMNKILMFLNKARQ